MEDRQIASYVINNITGYTDPLQFELTPWYCYNKGSISSRAVIIHKHGQTVRLHGYLAITECLLLEDIMRIDCNIARFAAHASWEF